MATRIQIRRDTAANWTAQNPTLAAGEFGFETDTNKLKCGDGSTAWTSLVYIADVDSYLLDTDLGVTVQAYDADTAKTDVASTWTATQSFNDNIKLQLGDANDLQIYHDATNSYIDDAGVGNLKIRASQVDLEKYTGETLATFVGDGAASLYYDNSVKLATVTGGVDVTGELEADTGQFNTSLNVDGAITATGLTLGTNGVVEKTSSTGSALMPVGTTAQQDGTPAQGYLRFNTTNSAFEGYDGSAWGSLGGATGAGGDAVFYENDQTVDNDYTITSGRNAMSTGPITVSSGVSVTIPTGSVWVVL